MKLISKRLQLFSCLLWCGLISTSCALPAKKRTLSDQEKKNYQLFGIINEARICPTVFDEKLKSSVVVGPCELVSCTETTSGINCVAEPEQK